MYRCICCGNETLPVPAEEAIAYICPVCWWENDVFLNSPDEPSDENHGMTLMEAQENYIKYGICDISFYPAPRKHYSVFTQNQMIDIVSHYEPTLTIGTNDTV